MSRCALALRTTAALALLLGTTWPVHAQHHAGGGGHVGPAHPECFHGDFHHHGYPYWGYPGWIGLDINLGYPYGPYYYPAPVVVPVPQPVVVVPPPAAPPPAAAPSAPSTAPPSSEPLPPPRRADDLGHVHVRVPADAVLWFDSNRTSQTGSERDFSTPALPAGSTASYEVRARWTQDGRPVERTYRVDVQPNRTTTVDFTAPPPAPG
jgi:uncharacterized protein (TIGR03000 family)